MLGVVGAAGMAIVGTQAWAEDDKPEHLHHHFDKIHEDCLKACRDCETACNQAALHCLKILETGKGELAAHAKAHAYTADCASFCSLSTMMIGRGSALMTLSCSLSVSTLNHGSRTTLGEATTRPAGQPPAGRA